MSWTTGGAAAGDLQQYAEDLAAGVTSSLGGLSQDSNSNGSADHIMAASAQDDLAVAQNGGMVSQDNMDDGDMDGDEDLDDDDMMDKISSSPSIDDGGSACQLPSFDKTLQPDASPGSSPESACFSEARSSSPYTQPPDYLPLQHTAPQPAPKDSAMAPFRHHHLLPGAFPEDLDEQTCDDATIRSARTEAYLDHSLGGGSPGQREDELSCSNVADSNSTAHETIHADKDDDSVDMQPEMDLLDGSDDADYYMADEGNAANDDLIIPYEGSTDEDDDDDDFFLQSTDPRFVDSGWGGECLHDTEDIDFELVYALHTFIATVEGQANATKGDAMVLLDDSNSYWWLVRVVKDSSIGELPSTFKAAISDLTQHRLPAGRAHRDAH